MTLLYHGTSQAALGKILIEGIKPRGKHGKSNWKGTVESNPNCVYLSEGYALHFAINATDDKQAAIIEVDTDRLIFCDLLPDEDAIEQTNRGKDKLPHTWTMKQRTRYYRKRMTHYFGQYDVSLKALGTCCHFGIIPISAVTRVATVDLAANVALRWACDPTISLMNYQFMAGYYRQLNRHIFGDEIINNLPRDGIFVTDVYQPAKEPPS